MARKKKSRPIAQEFDAYFGSGTLEDWQRLCHDVGLENHYGSITQCRKVHTSTRLLTQETIQGDRTKQIMG
jgi:hypothetical protein